MGIKKEAPLLFCFGMSHQALPTAQCSDGALICFDLAHIIEVERVIGLDYQLVLPVFLNVKGVPLVIVGELPVIRFAGDEELLLCCCELSDRTALWRLFQDKRKRKTIGIVLLLVMALSIFVLGYLWIHSPM